MSSKRFPGWRKLRPHETLKLGDRGSAQTDVDAFLSPAEMPEAPGFIFSEFGCTVARIAAARAEHDFDQLVFFRRTTKRKARK